MFICETPSIYLLGKSALYIGCAPSQGVVCLSSPSLFVSVDGTFEWKVGGSIVRTRTILLPAGKRLVAKNTGGVVGVLILDMLSKDFLTLKMRSPRNIGGVFYGLADEETILLDLKNIYQERLDRDSTSAVLKKAIYQGELVPANQIDDRIKFVIDYIRDHVHENLSVDELASLVNVSSTWLAQLFKSQTGVPVRRYRQWCRIYEATKHIAAGENMTDAALISGFSDSAHFSSAFKNAFGYSPRQFYSKGACIIQ